jgi:hypothetical protein
VLSLRADDCRREAERLKRMGVESSKSPRGWITAASTLSSTTPSAI